MHKRFSFWIMVVIAFGVWLSVAWMYQAQVKARQVDDLFVRNATGPLQQSCSTGPDLRIQRIRVEPDPPGVDQSYNVHVEIVNAGTVTGTVDSWSYLYVDRTPSGDPDWQAFAPTEGLGLVDKPMIEAHFTVTRAYATAGWHTISVLIDATDEIAEECGGEGNNSGATSFQILVVYTPTPTSTSPPTPTPFATPQIYLFTPEAATVARGDELTLQWQVYGQAVSVYLDGVLVPTQSSYTIRPTESHVYTLRAENPGGSVQKTSNITVVEPTATATPTETPCPFPTIYEFGASPSSVNRGEKTTLFWDVADASEVLLNGEAVSAVSSKTVKIEQTTTFTLVARNACGEIEETLTVQATYATPTNTFTPTLTRTPTRTSTPTYTPYPPTSTPTRNVLPTPTNTPTSSVTGARTVTTTATVTGQPTGTPTPTGTPSAFDSPLGTPTPTTTLTATHTPTVTPMPTATSLSAPTTSPLPTPTGTASPTATLAEIQATRTVSVVVVAQNPTATVTLTSGPAQPTASPTTIPATGTVRMYLCPLAVLLVFAIGVLVLSIVLPRIQERKQDLDPFQPTALAYGVVSPHNQERKRDQQDYVPVPGDTMLDSDEALPDEEHSSEGLSFDPLLDGFISPEHEEAVHREEIE